MGLLKGRQIVQFAEYFRPRGFKGIFGNKVGIGILKDHLKKGKFKTGYLMLGPAGLGKTSTAFTLSLAANCLNPSEPGEPCGECDSCLEPEGEHPDIFIINAASLNKATDIDNIIKQVKTHKVEYKILCIIMDEWHNLTKQARERMLEILEAAKMKATDDLSTGYLFILPTTSIDGMQPALLSRLSEIHFKPLSRKEMRIYLSGICNAIGLKPNNDAIDLIYDKAKGGIRKALNLLEDIRDYSSSQEVYDELSLELTEDVLQSATSVIAEHVFESIMDLNVFKANNIIKSHSDEYAIIENDFNDLYELMNKFIQDRPSSLQLKLIPVLDFILEQRTKAQLSPSNDDFRRLSACASFAIATLENTLLDSLGAEIRHADNDYWNLLRNLKPSFKFDCDSDKFILIVDEPDDSYEYDFLDDDTSPYDFFESGMESDFIKILFDTLDIDSHEYR